MTPITLRLLGPMEVLVGHTAVELPPSRKTRALLAYLALSTRPQRRERLCEMFWDVPDDPRGALRWSLSKIRQIVNIGGEQRLGADRNTVWLDRSGIAVDRDELVQATEQGLEHCSAEELEVLANMLHGPFLEDLYLPRCPDFEAWRTAEAIAVGSMVKALLLHLLERLETDPSRALRHAARLAVLAPRDDAVAAAIARLQELAQQGGAVVDHQGKAALQLAGAAVAIPAVDVPGDKPSIAVMAFDNLSEDPEQEYLSDGITEDIITELTRFRGLRVLARNSTFVFKKQPITAMDVRGKLGADYMVEGSVRRTGARVRITAQLIDTRGGDHLWAERYDRDLDEIFLVQDEITQTIVAAIAPAMGHAERQRALRKPPGSLSAWDWYHRGLSLMYEDTAETNAQAIVHLERALEVDPQFATAYAAAARVLVNGIVNGFANASSELLGRAMDLARRSVALDRQDAIAHYVLGMVQLLRCDHDEAIAEMRTAIALNPHSAEAHYGLGYVLLFSGRPEDAIAEFKIALDLSPHDARASSFYEMRSLALLMVGRVEEALAAARAAVRQPHAQHWAHAILCASLVRAGRSDELAESRAQLERISPGFSARSIREYLYFTKVPGQLDSLIDALVTAGVPEA